MDIGDIIDHVSMSAYENQWEALNKDLSSLNFAELTEVQIIAWMRSTWPMRSRLSGWQSALCKAKEALEARGLETKLHGLS